MKNLEVVNEEIKLGQVHHYKHRLYCTPVELKEILGEPSIHKPKAIKLRWNLKHEGVLVTVDNYGMRDRSRDDIPHYFQIMSENMVHGDRFLEMMEKELEFIRLPKDNFIMDCF